MVSRKLAPWTLRALSTINSSIVSPYDPGSLFSMNSLSRLEGAGIKIVSSLAEIPIPRLVSVAGVYLDKDVERALTEAQTTGASIEIIVGRWGSGKSQHPPTWRSLLHVLKELGLKELSQELDDYMLGKLKYLEAYHQIIAKGDSIDMWFIKVILLGAPRLGKTTVRRRLKGEIADISSSGEGEQPSTGIVESAHSVVIRKLSKTTAIIAPSEWIASKDLADEAPMLLKFLFDNHTGVKKIIQSSSEDVNGEIITDFEAGIPGPAEAAEDSSYQPDSTGALPDSLSSNSKQSVHRSRRQSQGMSEVEELYRKAASSSHWKEIEHLFKDTTFVKMEDTGGQPEFMDMQSALTIGPALYLFFCKLIDDLQSHYTVSYLSPSGESTTPVQSTYTVEEVLLSALASVSCFRSYSSSVEASKEDATSDTKDKLLASSSKSVVYILGTHKDLVSEEQIAQFDKKLQHSIRSTDFFSEDLVQFSSEDRMVLPIDNMHGGEGEIKKLREFLEDGIKQHFKKLSIPAAWLVLSLCLRKRKERTASLQSVLQLAGELGIPEKEVKLALWFLHHYAGVLMYFPKLVELEDTVICDTQIVYDSATNLIVNTFKFKGGVSKAASEKFRKTGQFSLEDISGATASVSGDYIPLLKLVKLLEHLNIIAAITPSTPWQPSSPQSSTTYFMPCVLQNATREELDKWWDDNSSPLSPAPLFIRYKCGFVPIGVFPAMVANLAGKSSHQLISKEIAKNRVQFQKLGGDYHTVTLISHPRYYAIHITRDSMAETATHEVCSEVRGLVESTLKTVTSHMNYNFSAEYQLSFECPSHPGRDHLCTVTSEDTLPHFMLCSVHSKPLKMKNCQLIWFKQCSLEPDIGTEATPKYTRLPVKSLEAFDRGFPGIVFWDAPFHQSIASQGATMELSQAGIFLSIPAQALSSAEKDVDLFIHPCFNGPFELPAGYESASPTYLIQPSSKVKFDRDATLQIHHYASLQSEEDCEEMAFLYSSPKPQYRQSKPVYSFNKFERSSEIFRPNSHVGEIKLQHFCLITIGRKRKVNSQTGVNNSKKGSYYSVRLYRGTSPQCVSAVFCMCLYHPLYITHCDSRVAEEYRALCCKGEARSVCLSQMEDEVTLCVQNSEGWSVTFDRQPTITKMEVDLPKSFDVHELTDYPPKFFISAHPNATCSAIELVMPQLVVQGLNVECSFEIVIPGYRYTSLSPASPSRATSQNGQAEASFTSSRKEPQNSLNLKNILLELVSISMEWSSIGIVLGLGHEIGAIGANYPTNVKKCMEEIITRWLMTSSQLSWTTLCEALRSELVNHPVLAKDIERKYCIHEQ